MALFHKVIFTVAVSLQPAVREQLILPLCKLRHNILYASRIIRRTVQLPAETGKHDEVAVRIDEPRGQILPFQVQRSEEHTSELQSRFDLVCRLLLEKKKQD